MEKWERAYAVYGLYDLLETQRLLIDVYGSKRVAQEFAETYGPGSHRYYPQYSFFRLEIIEIYQKVD